MTRWMAEMGMAGLVLACSPMAHAQSEMPPELIEASRRPGGAEVLRRAKEEDHRQVVRLNMAQARSTAARDRAMTHARDDANDRAQAQYEARLAAWHRQVENCRAGEWSQCDR